MKRRAQAALAVAWVLSAAEPAADGGALDSPRLQQLAAQHAAGGVDALGRFWEELAGRAPLIEPIPERPGHVRITFVWRAPEPGPWSVALNGLGSERPLRRMPGTDLWYRTEAFPADSRFSYGFTIRPSPIRAGEPAEPLHVDDDLNPRRFDDRALVELPAAPPQPWVVPRPGVPAGTLSRHAIRSEILDEERTVTVYTPAAPGKLPGLLLAFDASTFGAYDGSLVPTPTILDNLIHAGEIPPLVAVLVHNPQRTRDLTCSRAFADFLGLELVPWVRQRYRVSHKPSRTIVSGVSFGGLMASCAALRHPRVFGNVLSQSGAYWYAPDETTSDDRRWLVELFKRGPRLPVRFYLEVGRFEGGLVHDNRALRDVLEAKGYDVHYAEYSGGHHYACWRGSLADGLIALTRRGR